MTFSDPSAIWLGMDESPPHPGAVLVLNYHHDGESHWCIPQQAQTRIELILDGGKPEEEWGERMEAMQIVPWGEWVGRSRGALEDYYRAISAAVDDYSPSAEDGYFQAISAAGREYISACLANGAIAYPAEAWAVGKAEE